MAKSWNKVTRKIWQMIVRQCRGKTFYPYLYPSYWHYLRHSQNEARLRQHFFLTARPNLDAGIGHQIANWISGYWWAKEFNIQFSHSPFSTIEWDKFLGFGQGEPLASELLNKGYKKVLLPLFDEANLNEVLLIKNIITSYSNKNIIFVTEQDQFYKNQYGVISDIQKKFYNAPARATDRLVFDAKNFNIALHIRRGDIAVGQIDQNPNLLMRWQNYDYFKNVLTKVLESLPLGTPTAIYIFSQGSESDFKDFESFSNIRLCLEMTALDSFLHMTRADLLITSKSSFSYKPALLNRGIKICPEDFWHGYPSQPDWILADENGNFEINKLNLLR